MAADHYCLKWNNFHSSIVTAFESLQSSEDLVDVTLMCEGRNVKAHKVILSACSPYFRNLFKENPCQHPVIILKDVLHCDLVAIMHFMYQGEVLITQDGLASFLKTADLLQVSGLAGSSSQTVIPDETSAKPQPVVTQTGLPSVQRSISPMSPSPKPTRTKKETSEVAVVKNIPVDKEVFIEEEEYLLPIEKPARFESETEPIQSCSYQQQPDIGKIKMETDQDLEFHEMDSDYSHLSHENEKKIKIDDGQPTEEQSILERSLKAEGENSLLYLPETSNHGLLRRKTKSVIDYQKFPSRKPVLCPRCYRCIKQARYLKTHLKYCMELKDNLRDYNA